MIGCLNDDAYAEGRVNTMGLDTTTIVRMVAGLIFVIILTVQIFYILTLSRALGKCSPPARTMEPGMVWLLLIPLVGIVWHFLVVFALSNSLGNELRARGILNGPPEPGKSIGLAFSICWACSVVPLVNLPSMPAALILGILYWVKIAEFSRVLDQTPPMYNVPNYPQAY